ncbi:hypothetical protein COCNU_scaffold011065G000010 [Cocos nucifera]|nr:hypothetical protein [Cocos nucifera]
MDRIIHTDLEQRMKDFLGAFPEVGHQLITNIKALVDMKDELASEVERRKKVEAEIAEGEKWIAEAKEWAILDFKASKELEDNKIAFTKEAFIKRFKLC